MTAVANPPNFPQLSRSSWGSINGNSSMNQDEVRGMFAPRKNLSRNSSSSSLSSDSSNTSVATNGAQTNGTSLSGASDVSQWSSNGPPRKRPPPKNPWPTGKPDDFPRANTARPNGMLAQHGGMQQGPGAGQPPMAQQGMMRPMGAEQLPAGQPVLYLLSLNGTFERKTIAVPFAPESLRIGRQTNQKTVPTATNGFFDSKVLSRQHAEIFAERNGKIYIRDVKSSNGTFVNGTRLSQENRESEPHELQTADHLELGIDIVSEDQKTVVHHKVAAKVEHAGFLTSSNNVLDMSFGDLDPANGNMMMSAGGSQMRGRTGNNVSMNNNGRMLQNGPAMNAQTNGMVQQRPFFMSPIATDQIMKRLTTEMRNARIQAQDLSRTNQFVTTLLSKEDLKDLEKSEAAEAPKPQPMVNGNAKARFSDPPAPPPQQPLPEKPDVPSLKRGPTERPKSGPTNSSPARQDNLSQIIQLTEALNNAKRDIDTQTTKMRDLEVMLEQEREARAAAEQLAMRLEESAKSQMNGNIEESKEVDAETSTVPPTSDEPERIREPLIDDVQLHEYAAQETAATLQTRLDALETQMKNMKDQLEQWQQRCETVESERDADRKSLADMVVQLRAEEALRLEAQKKARSRSRPGRTDKEPPASEKPATGAQASGKMSDAAAAGGTGTPEELEDTPTLSRANTITPFNTHMRGSLQDGRLHAGLPYASMLGVVLIGMGMMAYINGWQAPPPRIER